MKLQIHILLAGFLLFLNGFSKAQEVSNKKAVNDTLNYLKRFETNKEKYIGKSFSRLLKDLAQMQPKTAKSIFNDDQARSIPGTQFGFSGKAPDSGNEVILLVKWKADNIPTAPIEFSEQEHNYRFTVSEQNFFMKKVVKDIIVYK